jgi:hypothetical protein
MARFPLLLVGIISASAHCASPGFFTCAGAGWESLSHPPDIVIL